MATCFVLLDGRTWPNLRVSCAPVTLRARLIFRLYDDPSRRNSPVSPLRCTHYEEVGSANDPLNYPAAKDHGKYMDRGTRSVRMKEPFAYGGMIGLSNGEVLVRFGASERRGAMAQRSRTVCGWRSYLG